MCTYEYIFICVCVCLRIVKQSFSHSLLSRPFLGTVSRNAQNISLRSDGFRVSIFIGIKITFTFMARDDTSTTNSTKTGTNRTIENNSEIEVMITRTGGHSAGGLFAQRLLGKPGEDGEALGADLVISRQRGLALLQPGRYPAVAAEVNARRLEAGDGGHEDAVGHGVVVSHRPAAAGEEVIKPAEGLVQVLQLSGVGALAAEQDRVLRGRGGETLESQAQTHAFTNKKHTK